MIVFQNKGEIDMRVVTTFGLCDKVGKNPIGYFGTGLKYAIAVLMRNGIKLVLWKGEERYEFYTRRGRLRTIEADWIVMKGPRGEHVLAFTTELGKNWEPWQAFRELICNTLDEGGTYYKLLYKQDAARLPAPGFTTIILEGDTVSNLYDIRDTIILTTEPLYKNWACEIHKGDGKWLYYRGIRVHKNEKPALYNYNVLSDQRLTEDRTLDGIWGAHYAIAQAVAACEEQELVDAILTAPEERMESAIDFSYGTPSKTFVHSVYRRTSTFGYVNPSAIGLFTTHMDSLPSIPTLEPNDVQKVILVHVWQFWQQLGVPINQYLWHISDRLPPKIEVRAYAGGIYFTPGILKKDLDHVLALAYECFLKLHYKLDRGTKESHKFLVEHIVQLAKKWHERQERELLQEAHDAIVEENPLAWKDLLTRIEEHQGNMGSPLPVLVHIWHS